MFGLDIFKDYPWLENAVWIVIALVVGSFAIWIILALSKKGLRKTKLDQAVHVFIINSERIVLWLALGIAIMTNLGVNPAALIAALSAAGAAVALALKDSLANVAGGIMLLVTKPFKQGDMISMDGASGFIEEINVLKTTLRTVDNKKVFIPNGMISTGIIQNYSDMPTRRVDCVFLIGNDADIYKAKELLLALADTDPRILKTPEPIVGVSGHSRSAMNLDFKVWCNTCDVDSVRYFIEENARIAFDEGGIDRANPSMSINLKK